MKIRLLLVEDHKTVRQALKAGLEATGEVQVVAEAATAREAIAASEVTPEAEVALMDVELRDPEVGAAAASGVGAAVAIRRDRPRFPIGAAMARLSHCASIHNTQAALIRHHMMRAIVAS